jgi:hypothetical protein
MLPFNHYIFGKGKTMAGRMPEIYRVVTGLGQLSVSTLKRIWGKVRYGNSPNNFILFRA